MDTSNTAVTIPGCVERERKPTLEDVAIRIYAKWKGFSEEYVHACMNCSDENGLDALQTPRGVVKKEIGMVCLAMEIEREACINLASEQAAMLYKKAGTRGDFGIRCADLYAGRNIDRVADMISNGEEWNVG
ncbi:MAG: hypothetical protein HF312_15650 [Ignavibacteria bacterium]|jgi:hypothetical protein|nr:hypothetical protein [Ignavibacteria bacterium]